MTWDSIYGQWHWTDVQSKLEKVLQGPAQQEHKEAQLLFEKIINYDLLQRTNTPLNSLCNNKHWQWSLFSERDASCVLCYWRLLFLDFPGAVTSVVNLPSNTWDPLSCTLTGHPTPSIGVDRVGSSLLAFKTPQQLRTGGRTFRSVGGTAVQFPLTELRQWAVWPTVHWMSAESGLF